MVWDATIVFDGRGRGHQIYHNTQKGARCFHSRNHCAFAEAVDCHESGKWEMRCLIMTNGISKPDSELKAAWRRTPYIRGGKEAEYLKGRVHTPTQRNQGVEIFRRNLVSSRNIRFRRNISTPCGEIRQRKEGEGGKVDGRKGVSASRRATGTELFIPTFEELSWL